MAVVQLYKALGGGWIEPFAVGSPDLLVAGETVPEGEPEELVPAGDQPEDQNRVDDIDLMPADLLPLPSEDE